MRPRFPFPLTAALAGCAMSCVATPPVPAGGEPALEIVFLDVGQGDAAVVRSPEGQVALIDAGPGAILPTLRALGIDSVHLAVASHPHADHIGGMADVIGSLPVRYYMDNGVPHTTTTYRRLIRTVRRSDAAYLVAQPRTIALGSASIRVMPLPLEGSLNNRSIGLVIEHGAFRAILTGDSEADELNFFLDAGVPDVTVLKAAHHGSRDAVTPAWLARTKPEVVVISAGEGNPYGHPHPWAMRYYEAGSRAVYRTDRDGRIRVRAWPDGRYQVITERDNVRTDANRPRPAPVAETDRPSITLRVVADAPGNDHHNPNGEYVLVHHHGEIELGLAGWRLCDAARHCYRFPSDARLGPHATIALYTGRGRSGGDAFYMGSGRAVWNNDGDIATLTDDAGRVRARYVY